MRESQESLHIDNDHLHFVNTITWGLQLWFICVKINMCAGGFVDFASRHEQCIHTHRMTEHFLQRHRMRSAYAKFMFNLYITHTHTHRDEKGVHFNKVTHSSDLLVNLSLSQLTKCDWLIQIIRIEHTNAKHCRTFTFTVGERTCCACCVTSSTNRTLSPIHRIPKENVRSTFVQFVMLIGCDRWPFLKFPYS